MICARSRSLALVVVSYNCRSSVTWVSDKGGRVRGGAIVPFRKDGQHHITPALYRKYFLEAYSIEGVLCSPPASIEQPQYANAGHSTKSAAEPGCLGQVCISAFAAHAVDSVCIRQQYRSLGSYR